MHAAMRNELDDADKELRHLRSLDGLAYRSHYGRLRAARDVE